MRKIKQETGLSLIELIVVVAITGIIVVPLTSIFQTQLRIPARLASEVTAGRQIQKSTLVLIEDAQSAKSFTPGTDPEYGTFAWTELAGPNPVVVTSRYFFKPGTLEVSGKLLRALTRGNEESNQIIILDGILQFSDIQFEIVEPVWDYDEATRTWSYTEGQVVVAISQVHEAGAQFGTETLTESLIANFRPQLDRPVGLPSAATPTPTLAPTPTPTPTTTTAPTPTPASATPTPFPPTPTPFPPTPTPVPPTPTPVPPTPTPVPPTPTPGPTPTPTAPAPTPTPIPGPTPTPSPVPPTPTPVPPTPTPVPPTPTPVPPTPTPVPPTPTPTPTPSGFTWFTNAHDISLSTTGSWQDIDLSSDVPVGATGAIVEVVNTGTSSSNSGVVRGKGDGNDYMSNSKYEEIEAETHRWQIVKVDSSRRIQGYVESAQIDFKLLGYTTGSDPSYFTTPPDITPSTTSSWTTVDVSSHVDTGADGVILLIDSTSSSDRDYAIREIGSSFSTTNRELEEYGNTMYLVGINGSDQFEVRIQSTLVKIYLVGQTKGSVVYYTDDIAVSDPSTNSWQELDADTYSIPAEANGLVFRAENTGSTDRKTGFRHADSVDDWNKDLGGGTHFQSAIGLKADNTWDEFMERTAINVTIAAYTKGP